MTNPFIPRTIKESLDKLVVGQEDAKQALSVAIVRQLLRANKLIESDDDFCGERLLIMGKTGTGKTFLLQKLNHIFHNRLNFIWVNTTEFSGTTWQGKGLTDILKQINAGLNTAVLYEQEKKYENELKYHPELTRDQIHLEPTEVYKVVMEALYKTVIIFDEFDKVSSRGTSNEYDGESKRTFQNDLLKFIESYEFNFVFEKGVQFSLNIKNTLCVYLGAFEGFDELLAPEKQLGFTHGTTGLKSLQEALVEYGFRHELVGRLSMIVKMNPLTDGELRQIIKNNAYLQQIMKEFLLFNVRLEVKDSFIEEVLEKSKKAKEGARSILPVLKSLFTRVYQEIDSLEGRAVFIDTLDYRKLLCSEQSKSKQVSTSSVVADSDEVIDIGSIWNASKN